MAEDLNIRLRNALGFFNVQGVKDALKLGADPNYRNGYPIIFTSERGGIPNYDEIMRVLLEAGANPNQQGPGGVPVLANAGKGRSRRMIEMLLQAGADPNVSYRLQSYNPQRPYYEYQSVLDGLIDGIRRNPMSVKTYTFENIKVICEATNSDEVERLKKKYHPDYANLLKCHPTHTKAEIAERVSPAMAGLNKTAKKQYGFETEFPNIEKNIGEYAFKERKYGSGRRKTKKRKDGKKKTKKRK